MRVARWGNSLAIRLPNAVVEALRIEEGDEVEVTVKGERAFEIDRYPSCEQALERLRALRRPLPPGWRFDRDDANSR